MERAASTAMNAAFVCFGLEVFVRLFSLAPLAERIGLPTWKTVVVLFIATEAVIVCLLIADDHNTLAAVLGVLALLHFIGPANLLSPVQLSKVTSEQTARQRRSAAERAVGTVSALFRALRTRPDAQGILLGIGGLCQELTPAAQKQLELRFLKRPGSSEFDCALAVSDAARRGAFGTLPPPEGKLLDKLSLSEDGKSAIYRASGGLRFRLVDLGMRSATTAGGQTEQLPEWLLDTFEGGQFAATPNAR